MFHWKVIYILLKGMISFLSNISCFQNFVHSYVPSDNVALKL